jgi:hypothetical protein
MGVKENVSAEHKIRQTEKPARLKGWLNYGFHFFRIIYLNGTRRYCCNVLVISLLSQINNGLLGSGFYADFWVFIILVTKLKHRKN